MMYQRCYWQKCSKVQIYWQKRSKAEKVGADQKQHTIIIRAPVGAKKDILGMWVHPNTWSNNNYKQTTTIITCLTIPTSLGVFNRSSLDFHRFGPATLFLHFQTSPTSQRVSQPMQLSATQCSSRNSIQLFVSRIFFLEILNRL